MHCVSTIPTTTTHCVLTGKTDKKQNLNKMKITVETIIQRNKEILASDLDGEKVMMSIEKGEYYGLGKTGTFIWDNIEESIKIVDLIKLITEKYNVEKNQCFEDIAPFIKDLVEKEMIIATN
jgi:hypothetical protein